MTVAIAHYIVCQEEERGIDNSRDVRVLGGDIDDRNVVPAALVDALTGESGHFRTQLDAHDAAGRAHGVAEQRQTQSRPTSDVDNGVAGLQREQVDCPTTPRRSHPASAVVIARVPPIELEGARPVRLSPHPR